MTNIKNYSKEVKKAADIIKKGGVVIFPTDTVFGIGCRWDNEEAIKRIYQIKSRPENLPFPILLSDKSQVDKIAIVTPLAQDLMKRYWPGGLTIVLKLKRHTPPVIASGAWQSIGFRIPDNQLVRGIIEKSGPIVGTSANFHGRSPVKTFEKLDPELIKLVDYVVPGNCKGGIESTVVDATGIKPILVRKGAVTPKSLKLTISTVKREEVVVELADNWSKFGKKLVISQQTGSQALIPAIVKILKSNKCSLKDIASIDVDAGPGSFTGTRVGVAVANALGFALDIPINGKLAKIAIPLYEKSKFD